MECAICGNETDLYLDNCRDYITNVDPDMVFSVVRCKNCGTGYTMPPMSVEELNRFYPADYEPYTEGKRWFKKASSHRKRKIAHKLRKLKPSKDATLFEIGTGNGDMLYFLREAGFHVSGSDLDANGIVNIKKKYNINVIPGDAENLEFKQKYDVVAMRQVLEHINGFPQVIQNIYNNALQKDGILYLAVPRLDSLEIPLLKQFSYALSIPQHRIHFSKKGLLMFLRQTGFRDIKFHNIENPYDYVRGYFKMLKKQSSSGKKFLFAIAAPFYAISLIPMCFCKANSMEVIAKK